MIQYLYQEGNFSFDWVNLSTGKPDIPPPGVLNVETGKPDIPPPGVLNETGKPDIPPPGFK